MTRELLYRDSNLLDMTPIRFFEEMGRQFFGEWQENQVKTDIHETVTDYLVEAELPGIPKDNIVVHYEDNILTIEGQYCEENQVHHTRGNLIRSERSYQKIRRQFILQDVVKEQITANYENGILTIKLPKKQSSRRIKQAIPID